MADVPIVICSATPQKRDAILLAYANGTEHLGVLPDFSVQPRIRQGWASWRQQGKRRRIVGSVISD